MAPHVGELFLLAVVLFASTNVDDIFVLLGFYADPSFRVRHVVVGQFLGIGALYGASVVASLASIVVAPAYIGLLGIVPIVLGLKSLRNLAQGQAADEDDPGPEDTTSARSDKILAVAAVTLANGGDNISIYTPLFATRSAAEIALIGAVFALMTLVWLGSAYWLIRHPTLGAPIRRYGHRVVPFVLIALGAFILYEAGTFGLLASIF